MVTLGGARGQARQTQVGAITLTNGSEYPTSLVDKPEERFQSCSLTLRQYRSIADSSRWKVMA
jgi:hypothetical protein